MIEFIVRPCGWPGEAPADLRRRTPGGASAWRSYSTARCLGAADPVVLRTVDFGDLEVDSGMRIELLPEALAGGLRAVGLELASTENMNELRFRQALAEALALIARVPPLFGTVAGLCRSLHVLNSSGVDIDTSYSDPALPFSIFVSCPWPSETHRAERLAENIVHEALHLQLSLVETAEPLVVANQGETRLFSPWKNEPRTLQGLLHGVYVFGNLRHFWNRIAVDAGEPPGSRSTAAPRAGRSAWSTVNARKRLASPNPARRHDLTGKPVTRHVRPPLELYSQRRAFAERRREEIDRELAAVQHLATNRDLTATGQRLVTSLLARS